MSLYLEPVRDLRPNLQLPQEGEGVHDQSAVLQDLAIFILEHGLDMKCIPCTCHSHHHSCRRISD